MGFKIDVSKYRFKEKRTAAEISVCIYRASGVVKMVCGVLNNLSHLYMLDARDKMRDCPLYRQRVKSAYEYAFREYDSYRRMLIATPVGRPRFFHVADMDEVTRKRFGDISDALYFEFWEGTSGSAYEKSLPAFRFLAGKYRTALEHHGARHADLIQWPMAVQAVLELSVDTYDSVMREISEQYMLPPELLKRLFSCFSIKRVAVAWKRALDLTLKDSGDCEPDGEDNEGIMDGLTKLTEVLTDPSAIYSSLSGAVEDYEEIFSTKSEQTRTLKEIDNLKNNTKT